MNSPKIALSQLSNKTFPSSYVSDEQHLDAAAGQHQKLIRRPDGKHELVIRQPDGAVEHVPVLAFSGGFVE